MTIKEDAPTVNAGSGNIAGIGVGPQGEPGVSKKAQRRIQRKEKSTPTSVILSMLRRKAPNPLAEDNVEEAYRSDLETPTGVHLTMRKVSKTKPFYDPKKGPEDTEPPGGGKPKVHRGRLQTIPLGVRQKGEKETELQKYSKYLPIFPSRTTAVPYNIKKTKRKTIERPSDQTASGKWPAETLIKNPEAATQGKPRPLKRMLKIDKYLADRKEGKRSWKRKGGWRDPSREGQTYKIDHDEKVAIHPKTKKEYDPPENELGIRQSAINTKKGKKGKVTPMIHRDSLKNRIKATLGTHHKPAYLPEDTFAGAVVFEVNSKIFHNLTLAKRKGKHWRTYLEEDDCYAEIREWARKNKGPIVVRNECTGEMRYVRYGR